MAGLNPAMVISLLSYWFGARIQIQDAEKISCLIADLHAIEAFAQFLRGVASGLQAGFGR
jgi:hypothetical protein